MIDPTEIQRRSLKGRDVRKLTDTNWKMKPIEKAKSLWEHLANKNQHTHQGKHEVKDFQQSHECAKMQIKLR